MPRRNFVQGATRSRREFESCPIEPELPPDARWPWVPADESLAPARRNRFYVFRALLRENCSTAEALRVELTHSWDPTLDDVQEALRWLENEGWADETSTGAREVSKNGYGIHRTLLGER